MNQQLTQYKFSLDNRQAMFVLMALRVAEDVLPTCDRWLLQKTHNDISNQIGFDD